MSYPIFLRTFLAVYRSGSQTRAAEELFLTQPAVSQHIKSLEAHIGKPLFVRETKGVKPTAIAHQLASMISSHLDSIDNIWESFKSSVDQRSGTIYIGGIREFIATQIIPSLSSFLEKNAIRIRFVFDHENLVERLLNNEIDLAIFLHQVSHPNIECEKLYKEEFILVGHPKWKKEISLKKLKSNNTTDLEKIPWISYNENFLFIKEYYQTIFGKPFTGETKIVVEDLWSLLESVLAGMGIAVLPSYFCKQNLKKNNLTLLYNPIEPPTNYFYLGWKKGALRYPIVELVVDHLRKKLRTLRS